MAVICDDTVYFPAKKGTLIFDTQSGTMAQTKQQAEPISGTRYFYKDDGYTYFCELSKNEAYKLEGEWAAKDDVIYCTVDDVDTVSGATISSKALKDIFKYVKESLK